MSQVPKYEATPGQQPNRNTFGESTYYGRVSLRQFAVRPRHPDCSVQEGPYHIFLSFVHMFLLFQLHAYA